MKILQKKTLGRIFDDKFLFYLSRMIKNYDKATTQIDFSAGAGTLSVTVTPYMFRRGASLSRRQRSSVV